MMRRWWSRGCAREWLAAARYTGLLLLMNAGTVSYGLALGWVSLASGEGGYIRSSGGADGGADRGADGGADGGASGGADGAGGAGSGLVWGAASTFAGALLGVALAAHALVFPRKLALLLVSILFTLCWTLKLVAWAGVDSEDEAAGSESGWRWWVVGAGRVLAGLAGNLAWCLAPVFAKEVSVAAGYEGGAGATVPAVAHNVGVLLMYLAADCGIHPQVVVWWCCVCTLVHCAAVVLLVPESPAFLAAHNRRKEAVEVVCWVRGRRAEEAAVCGELARLPPVHTHARSTLTVLTDMWSSGSGMRRRVTACVWLVAGQQLCGVLALEQFAERVFLMLSPARQTHTTAHVVTDALTTQWVSPLTTALPLRLAEGRSPPPPPPPAVPAAAPLPAARFALVLGAAQLVASLIELYLVDRISHRTLIVCSGVSTSLLAGASAVLSRGGGGAARWAGAALVAATAADSLGLHPVPYAVITEIFHYEERGAVLCVSYAAEELVSGVQTVGYAALAGRGGVSVALGAAAAATALYCLSAALVLPSAAPPQDKYKQSVVTRC